MDVQMELETMESSLTMLTKMAKRPEIDIEFEDLKYSVSVGMKAEKKDILKRISGSFHTGQLTAILGPSGAGKSSLMNILVGYNNAGVTGNLSVNGKPRDLALYHKLSCYIMQDDLMQQCISVDEAMKVAANLKLGDELKSDEKALVIDEILNTIGLASCRNVRTENLSGGQRKRLAVALELVNNPPIIFLDEPTSGLDIVSTNQMLNLLKHLAHCGRTIICTIHQPSATMFSLFDKVYILANGKCVYQGEPKLLVPFMSSVDYHCPVTYNPADYILEVIQMDVEKITKLSNAIDNGKVNKTSENCDIEVVNRRSKKIELEEALPPAVVTKMSLPTSFFTQFSILFRRMMLQKCRNMTALWIQVLHHVLSAGLVGGIFFGIGNKGEMPLSNFKYCLSILVFFMYTYVMVPILLYPSEFELLKREYFNRWYGLKPYFLALMLANIPVMVLFGVIFIAITYILTDQIMEFDRFLLFCLASILTGYCSEGFGLAIGAVFSVRNGSILGPSLVSPLLALCVYGLGYGPFIETGMRYLMRLSYLRYGMVGISLAIYEGRPKMECEELFCLYSDSKVLLRDLGMTNTGYVPEMLGLLGFTLFYRFLTYMALRHRLQTEYSSKFLNNIFSVIGFK